MRPMKVVCYVLDVRCFASDYYFWLDQLPEERRAKSLRFVQEKDRLLSLGGGLLIEAFVGRGKYRYGEYGKPYKKHRPRFSLSHSGTYCFLAVASNEVGADIQRIENKDSRMVEYCFDEEERTRIKTQEDFFSAWSEKEALGKYFGFGIKDPKKTPVRPLADNKVLFEGKTCYFAHGKFEDYVFAVAAGEPIKLGIEPVDLEKIKRIIL